MTMSFKEFRHTLKVCGAGIVPKWYLDISRLGASPGSKIDSRTESRRAPNAVYFGADHVSGSALAAGVCMKNVDFDYRRLAPCRSFRCKVDGIGPAPESPLSFKGLDEFVAENRQASSVDRKVCPLSAYFQCSF